MTTLEHNLLTPNDLIEVLPTRAGVCKISIKSSCVKILHSTIILALQFPLKTVTNYN